MEISITREQEENLKTIIETIEGLKLQSKVAFASKGNNKLIDREKLKEAHKKIHAPSLQHRLLKDYMREKEVVSYVDINIKDFKSYYLKHIQ